jgi:hypothetical protein
VHGERNGQYFPLELAGSILILAAREWPLLLDGEVGFTLDRSRSNGRFRGMMGACK